MFDKLSANRRDLLIAPLLAAIPAALLDNRANASPVDSKQDLHQAAGSDHLGSTVAIVLPRLSSRRCSGAISSEPGLDYYLVKWYPGFHECPTLVRNRPAVRRGVWQPGGWRAGKTSSRTTRFRCRQAASSGALRERRTTTVSRRPARKPAVIAICGMGLITYHLVDRSKPERARAVSNAVHALIFTHTISGRSRSHSLPRT